MSLYRALLLALFVVGGAVAAGVSAGATAHDDVENVADGHGGAGAVGDAAGAGVGPADVQGAAANNTTDESPLGADISSFMQASASEVDGAVEAGMWSASFNETDNRTKRVQLVERRTAELRSDLAELRERKAELAAEREAGNVSETAYKAQVSSLLGRINALESAIDSTAMRAEEVDADVEELGTLRTATANLTGPEIASVARNVTGVTTDPTGVGDGQRGPPDDERPGASGSNGTEDGNGLGVGEGSDVANGTGVGNGEGPNVGADNATGASGDGASVGNGSGADVGNAGAGGDGADTPAADGGSDDSNASRGGGAGSDAPTTDGAANDARSAVAATVDGSAEVVLGATTATPGLLGHVETGLEAPAVAP